MSKEENKRLDKKTLKQDSEICTAIVHSSQNTNKCPAASPSNARAQCQTILSDEAPLTGGNPVVLPDGPMTSCETVVAGMIVVAMLGIAVEGVKAEDTGTPGSVAVAAVVAIIGVLWDVPVGIERDGIPVTS